MKNSNIILTVLLSLSLSYSWSQTARVQVIHNSADAAAALVDIYLDTALLLDDFGFRNASPFIDAPAGTPIVIGVAGSNSTSVGDTITSFEVTLTAGETYIVVANGIVSSTGYNPNPAFNLDIITPGREAATTAGNTDIQIMHGSTDAPTVDVVAVGVGTIANDLAYASSLNAYLEVATADLTLQVTDQNQSTVVATYSAPLATLGLQDAAITVLASGFLDPSQNSNGEPFGLYVALATGGALVPLPIVAGLEDILVSEFSILPNPASDNINIKINPRKNTNVEVSIFNTTGQKFIEKSASLKAGNENIQINISDLPKGVYTLRIANEYGISSKRFVKN